MMAGMALVALFNVLTSLSSALPSLLVARLGLRLGRGLAEAGERGMLADLAGRAPAPRGRALALQQAAVGLGVAIGAPVGGAVVEEFGPRSALLCVSGAVVAALGMYALLPETAATAASSSPRKDAGDNWRAIGMEAQEADDCGVKPTGRPCCGPLRRGGRCRSANWERPAATLAKLLWCPCWHRRTSPEEPPGPGGSCRQRDCPDWLALLWEDTSQTGLEPFFIYLFIYKFIYL